MIVQYSKYHHAAFGNFANNFSGNINKKYSNVQNYFYLRRINDSLLKANEMLYNKLKSDFTFPDTTSKGFIDSIRVDSMLQYKKFNYIGARVVSNSISSQSNYIVLAKGTNDNVKVGMGVVDPFNGVVGIITEVTEKYSVVMSLLHKDSHVSGKLLKGGETGTLNWDGKEVNLCTITGIPKSAKIIKGDEIVSSGFSTAFPRGLKLGKIESVYKETRTNYFRIIFRTAVDFNSLSYAYVIANADQDGVNEALNKIKKEP
jgi:rod shape-determining protein MreC